MIPIVGYQTISFYHLPVDKSTSKLHIKVLVEKETAQRGDVRGDGAPRTFVKPSESRRCKNLRSTQRYRSRWRNWDV